MPLILLIGAVTLAGAVYLFGWPLVILALLIWGWVQNLKD